MDGRAALQTMGDALLGVLRFEAETVHHVHDTSVTNTVICKYEALLHRRDLGGTFKRRYIAVITLRNGRILHLREYGGPFRACDL